jgi:glycosyltransferase involved in cell wall biosynthesis
MKTIRVLAVLEASTITGPAKNLLQFASLARADRFVPAVDVSIVTFRRHGDSDLLADICRELQIPLHVISERGRFDRTVIDSLAGLARSLAPDVIQTHAVKSHFLVRKAGLDRSFPWVAFHHGYTWQNWRVRMYNQLDRWSLRAAVRVVTVSVPFREELIRQGVPQERIRIVHNAIDPSYGATARSSAPELRARLGLQDGEPVILSVGRMSPEKDHLGLLDAFHRIHAAGIIDPHLVIVGEGPERPRIEHRIRALGLDSRVILTGHVSSAEPYYGIASVTVLSSRSEGSPNALLESMAALVPVVATSVGGIPEIVTNRESALLATPGDPDELARAISEVLTSPALADGLAQRARLLVEMRHSPDSRTRALCALYGEAHQDSEPAHI